MHKVVVVLLWSLQLALAAPIPWYEDGDGDGYGNAGVSTVADSAAVLPGWVISPLDCDDTRSAIHPVAIEVCNARDDDCDGQVDEGACPCARGTLGQRTFQFCTDTAGFDVALERCGDVGYGLAHVEGTTDNDYLANTARSVLASAWWIGGTDPVEGVWTWTDGTPWGFTLWQPGEPNNTGNEDCLSINNWASSTWNDAQCSWNIPRICEAGPDNRLWFLDTDGDGFGDVDFPVASMVPVPGAVLDSSDCDDADDHVWPGAIERCNGVDDDCNGLVDDAADADGDGYTVCTDCNDADLLVNPGRTEAYCDGRDNDCEPLTPDSPDFDGDGFGLCSDCNDAQALVYPGAPEIPCNGVDNDCNPLTPDQGDVDGDGFENCEDCNDADPAVFPGATEVACNGADDDCDPASPDQPDLDGDGYACTDCDDTDPAVHPGALEIRDNGIDENCDGLDAPPRLDTGAPATGTGTGAGAPDAGRSWSGDQDSALKAELSGCGCAAGGGGPTWLWLVGFGALWRRR